MPVQRDPGMAQAADKVLAVPLGSGKDMAWQETVGPVVERLQAVGIAAAAVPAEHSAEIVRA